MKSQHRLKLSETQPLQLKNVLFMQKNKTSNDILLTEFFSLPLGAIVNRLNLSGVTYLRIFICNFNKRRNHHSDLHAQWRFFAVNFLCTKNSNFTQKTIKPLLLYINKVFLIYWQ